MDDLISRSETIKKLYEYADKKHSTGEVELANGILKAACFIKKEDNIPTVAKDNWIPVTQEMPQQEETVQVTYLSSSEGKPMCNAVAYVGTDGKWHWDDVTDSLVMVEITAWKPMGEPYRAGGRGN